MFSRIPNLRFFFTIFELKSCKLFCFEKNEKLGRHFFFSENFYLAEKQNKQKFVKKIRRFVEFVKTCDELVIGQEYQ